MAKGVFNETRGVRNCNPLNIRRSKDPWQGLREEQADDAFFQFRTPADGIRAGARILINYQDKHGARTVERIIHRWAPPNENDTNAYINAVSGMTGFHPTAKLDMHSYEHLRPLIEAMIRVECAGYRYPEAVIDKAMVMAGVSPPEKPVTSTRTVRGSQVAAGATAVGVAAEAAKDVGLLEGLRDNLDVFQTAAPFLRDMLSAAPYVFAAVAIVGIGLVVWARLDDRRKGLR